MSAVETSAAQLDAELRGGAPIAVLDVRGAEAFAAWALPQENGVPVCNVPLDRLREDPAAVAERLPQGRALRVVCARGRSSLEAVALLEQAGVAATSVAGGMRAWGRLLSAHELAVPPWDAVVQLRRPSRGCLSYLLASGGEAIVVDPAPAVEPYLEAAQRHGATVVRVLDTHVHADHLSGARLLAERTGARLHVSRAALARGIADPERFAAVADGDALTAGACTARVVALPGHTSDMIGLDVGGALVAGDSLMAAAVARPDLEHGADSAEAAARVLHATIGRRMRPLAPATLLLPAHDPAGRRGAATAPRLGDVLASIELLELDEAAFAARLARLSRATPLPGNYARIIAANLAGADPDAGEDLEVGANNCAVGEAPALTA